jgi:hypothetical protein
MKIFINVDSNHQVISKTVQSNSLESFLQTENLPEIPVIDVNIASEMEKLEKISIDSTFDISNITKILLIENDLLKDFYIHLLEILNKHIDFLIVTPPEISEEDLELDGIYRKYIELKGHQVLLDWHTQEGETYYILNNFIKDVKNTLDDNSYILVIYIKNLNYL